MRVSLRRSGEDRLAVCLDAGAQRDAHTVRPRHLEFKWRGDVQKARNLRRVAWTDGQSALCHATHPAGLLDVMPGAWHRSEHP